MKKITLAFLAMLTCVSIAKAQEIISRNPKVILGKLVRIGNPDKRIEGWKDIKVRDEHGIIGKEDQVENDEYILPVPFSNMQQKTDKALQERSSAITPQLQAAALSVGSSFDGMGYTSVCPADPSSAVGPNHIVQMINGGSGGYVKVFSKTGAQLKAQFYMDAVTGVGGLGDPVVLYDQLADRWLITEFSNKSEAGSEGLVLAMSVTNDPTGAWKAYFFKTTLFPDYPKFSIWNNAYYAKTNNFRHNSYNGASIFAFDRAAMLAGSATVSLQVFSLGKANKYYSMCPVSLSGTTLPTTSGLFAYMNDNSWSGSATDSIGLAECKINFATPSASVVTTAASLAVAAFDPNGPSVTQPANGQTLDNLENRIMFHPSYRNFGTSASVVMANVVNANSVNGIRWYELTLPSAGAWSVKQQGTYSPDATHRFMPAINIDCSGNIGLIYNAAASATNIYPSVKFTGRLAGDPLGTMTVTETTIGAGTASSNCFNRYGDYNQLELDPTNNATFWGNGMYNKASSWSTRIGSFTLGTCSAPIAKTPPTKGQQLKLTPVNAGAEGKVAIFPNPASTTIRVFVKNFKPETVLSIVDLKGSTILQQKLISANDEINIAALKKGVYIVKVISGTDKTIVRLVKY